MSGEGKGKAVDSKIEELGNVKDFNKFIEKQQELFKIMFARIEQIEAYILLNDQSDLSEMIKTDGLQHLHESLQEEGRGMNNNRGRGGDRRVNGRGQ